MTGPGRREGVAVVATDLVKSYRDGERRVEVLRGTRLEVAAGELVAVVGPSGSGKSTLLHLLGGLDRPDEGRVRVGGTDLAGLDGGELAGFRNRVVGFVFQFHQLLPDFTAVENVMLPARIAGHDGRWALARAEELLEEVGLTHRLDHFPNQLSGGERQRVALCRALALEPPLLLADEPTGNLDPASGERVLDLLIDLQERHGTTTVLVTHNPEVARRCGRILTLEEGFLRPEGAAPDGLPGVGAEPPREPAGRQSAPRLGAGSSPKGPAGPAGPGSIPGPTPETPDER